jgi:hypothetical protein
MRGINLLLLLLLPLSFFSCTPQLTKLDAFPDHYAEDPLSILVLPPVNNSTAADAPDLYSTTILQPLAEAGFYVLPVQPVHQLLYEQGIEDVSTIENLPLAAFKEFFGADAVLYVVIDKWDTSYYVIGGSVTVALQFHLVSTLTGLPLWDYSGNITVDTTAEKQGGGLAGLLVQVLETAVNTAVADYVPIARDINFQCLEAIPAGSYHPRHQQDQKDLVKVIDEP